MPLRATAASLLARIGSAASVSNIGSHKAGKPLYKLPGIFCTSSWEHFLDDLDGVDYQREIRSNGKHSLVDQRAMGVWRGSVLCAPLRSHAFTLVIGEGEMAESWRAQISFLVP